MAKKRKTLPRNFDELIKKGDIAELTAVFDKCELNATGGYGHGTALHYTFIPDELVRWLIEKGADIEAKDIYGRTALHSHSMSQSGKIETLIEFGADVNVRDQSGNTPLHLAAANAFSPEKVELLLQAGAKVTVENERGFNPLSAALSRARGFYIEKLEKIVYILISAGIPLTEEMKKLVIDIGEDFEFHRENFNSESLPATDTALHQLYKIFEVQPVKRRIIHDGVSPIFIPPGSWENQYAALWELLIPSSGPAKTVQGEVLRIAGKVRDEIYRNGGANWDINFKKMLDAYLIYLQTGQVTRQEELQQAITAIKDIRSSGDAEDSEMDLLCRLAVEWIQANPNPIPLSETNYKR